MTGPTEVSPKSKISFHELLTKYRSPRELGDAVGDLAVDVRSDPLAPEEDVRLIDYLLRRAPGAAVDEAVRKWKAAHRA